MLSLSGRAAWESRRRALEAPRTLIATLILRHIPSMVALVSWLDVSSALSAESASSTIPTKVAVVTSSFQAAHVDKEVRA